MGGVVSVVLLGMVGVEGWSLGAAVATTSLTVVSRARYRPSRPGAAKHEAEEDRDA